MTIDSVSLEAANQFRIAFYNWSKQQVAREIDEEFPYLSRLRGKTAWRIMRFIGTLNEEEKRDFFQSRVRALVSNENLLEVGEQRGERDAYWDKQFTYYCFINPITASLEEKLVLGDYNKELSLKFNKKKFKRALKAALVPIIGEVREDRGVEWEHRREMGKWQVETLVELPRRGEAAYYHWIYTEEDPSYTLGVISFMSCLGLSSNTEWAYLSEEDLPLVQELITDFCTLFMQALPNILARVS